MEEFITSHPNSTIFHTPQWAEVIEKTFGYKSYNISAYNEGEMKGFLPLFYVKSFVTGNRLTNVPFVNHAEPIFYNDEIFGQLLGEIKTLMEKLGCKNLSIKSPKPLPPYEGFTYSCPYIRSILTLNADYKKVWSKMDKSSARWGVKKAGKEGVKVTSSLDLDILYEFYEIFSETRKKLGVPVFSIRFFKNMREILAPSFRLFLAKHNGKSIAGGMFLEYKDSMIYFYSASTSENRKLNANSLILWEAIKYACGKGLKIFDFGTDPKDLMSLLKFKEKWGATSEPIYNYYTGKDFVSDPSSLRALRNAWSNLPLGVTKLIGPQVTKHFG